ncbi:MAG: tRNA lysidine(34) synthetase TilS [Firmicutes bacterium]|nr:tRNA lysidine(34) synthetase TilS [Bacillota bacterium]
MCLFDLLAELSAEMNLTIHPVHVNHKFRPGAAEADQQFVEDFCRARGMECRSFVVDCNEMAARLKLTSEEAGRKARYHAFFTVSEEVAASGVDPKDIAIAVAQNANDQCETILFRIMRGTGIDGLAGIPYKRKGEGGFDIIRPILDITRDEIEKYCEIRNLNPRIDHTNNEAIYTRNKIRLELIPYMAENFNSNIVETVNRLGQIAAEDKDYMQQEARKAFEEACCRDEENSIFTQPLERLHKGIRSRVYNMCLSRAGLEENVTGAHLEAIEKVRLSQNPSASADLAEGFRVAKAYDKLVFFKESRQFSPDNWQLKKMTGKEYETYVKEASRQGKVWGAFGGLTEKEAEKLEIRLRRDGDYIAINGGKKKIQDFFVDSKVARLYRDRIGMLALGNNILWILPSEYFVKEQHRLKGRFSADFKANIQEDDLIIVLEQK